MAVDGEQIVGRLSVARDPHPASPHVADLGLFVAASHRRRGIGRLLLETAVAWAGVVGIRKLELQVFPWNVPAIRLYEEFGFVREGLRRGHYLRDGADVDALLMAFHLLRDRNPLHLQRPDQESPHLGLVARVEQRLTADEAPRGLDGGHELGDRRPSLRTTDRKRDPAGSPGRRGPPPAFDEGSPGGRRHSGDGAPCLHDAVEPVTCLCRLRARNVTTRGHSEGTHTSTPARQPATRAAERSAHGDCGDERVPPRRSVLTQRGGGREGCRAVRDGRRVELGLGLDVNPRQVEPIRVPASADRWIGRDLAVGVQPERLRQRGEARVAHAEEAFVPELRGERRCPRAVARIDGFVLAPGVVEQAEAEDDPAIHAVERGAERQPVAATQRQ